MTHRTNPITILDRIYKRLFWLLIPILRGFLYVLLDWDFAGWLQGAWLDLLVVLLILGISLLNWYGLRYEVTPEGFRLEAGFLVRREITVPAGTVAAVTFRQSVLMRLFGARRVFVVSDSGFRRRERFQLILSGAAAALFEGQCRLEVECTMDRCYHPRRREALLMALCGTNALTASAYAALYLFQLSRRLGSQIVTAFLTPFQQAAAALPILQLLPGILALLGLLILSFWLASLMLNYLYYQNSSVHRLGDSLHCRSGFFSRNRSVYKVSAIRGLVIRQNILTGISRIRICEILCPGRIKGRRPRKAAMIALKKGESERLLEKLLPEYKADQPPRHSFTVHPKALRRYLLLPCLGMGLFFGAFLLLSCRRPVLFPGSVFIGDLCLFAGLYLLLQAIYSLCAFRFTGGIEQADCWILRTYRHLSLQTVILRREQIVSVTVQRSRHGQKNGYADLVFRTCGGAGFKYVLKGIRL